MMKVKHVTMKCITVLMLLFGLAIAGCGKEITASDGSTITISPDHTQTGIAADTPVNFTVVVRYKDGTLMPNAVVKISGAFAVPRATPHYQFYFYPDAVDNPSNIAVDSGFLIQTGDNGSYMFSVEINSSNGTFADSIVGTSGTAIGSAAIAVN